MISLKMASVFEAILLVCCTLNIVLILHTAFIETFFYFFEHTVSLWPLFVYSPHKNGHIRYGMCFNFADF